MYFLNNKIKCTKVKKVNTYKHMGNIKSINKIIKINSNNDYFKFIIITVVILILFKQMDFFRKFFFLMTRNYETRLIKNYEYCGHESIGFLSDIKNKFDVTYKIPIINYGNSPNSSWYYANLESIKTNKVIFLNHNLHNKNFNYELNDKFSHYLEDYKILHKFNNCYLLEKK